jgi:hypothetical protein
MLYACVFESPMVDHVELLTISEIRCQFCDEGSTNVVSLRFIENVLIENYTDRFKIGKSERVDSGGR